MNQNLLSWRQISQLFRPFPKLTKTQNHLTWEISAKPFMQSIVAPCTLGVFVAARLECFPTLLCVLIFHQVLLNTEEGSRPPTSQINCLIDCRGGSEADGWPYKDLIRPYLQTFNPYFHKLEQRLGHRPPNQPGFAGTPVTRSLPA